MRDPIEQNETPSLKILVVTPYYFPSVGGAEILVSELFSRIAREASVTLLTPQLSKDRVSAWGASGLPVDPFPVHRYLDKVNLIRIPGHKISRGLIPPISLSAVRAVRREAKALRPDVIVSFYLNEVGFAALWASKAIKCSFAAVVCGSDLASTDRPALWRRYGRYLLRKADGAVYVSDYSRSQFWDADEPRLLNEHLIPNGVDLSFFNPRAGSAGVRERLGIFPDETMILAMQRLAPQKRVDVVIKALPYILRKHPKTKLVIGGIGSEKDRLKALAAKLGLEKQAIFVGHLGEDRNNYLAAADAFVFHSCSEAFGLVLAEAMAVGRPVITVKNTAIPEVVKDGETGLLCRPLDECALAEKINTIIENPKLAARLGAAGSEVARKKFDIDAVAGRYLGFLRDLASHPYQPARADQSAAVDVTDGAVR